MQGLLVVVKALHGTRQGVISASLPDATIQLTELGPASQQRHVITSIDDALTLLTRPQSRGRWFHRNAIFPGELWTCFSLLSLQFAQCGRLFRHTCPCNQSASRFGPQSKRKYWRLLQIKSSPWSHQCQQMPCFCKRHLLWTSSSCAAVPRAALCLCSCSA